MNYTTLWAIFLFGPFTRTCRMALGVVKREVNRKRADLWSPKPFGRRLIDRRPSPPSLSPSNAPNLPLLKRHYLEKGVEKGFFLYYTYYTKRARILSPGDQVRGRTEERARTLEKGS